MSARRARGVAVVLLWAAAGATVPDDDAAAQQYLRAPAALGQTGVVAVGGASVLRPGQVRAGAGAFFTEGSGGSVLDAVLTETDPDGNLLVIRGLLAVGLPRGIEAALSAPYLRLDDGTTSTDGLGDLTFTVKLKAREQRGWAPATAVSLAWIPETASESQLTSVTTNGYRAALAMQLALENGRGWSWTVLTEIGGLLRDPGRPESDASALYGLAGIFPLSRTGLYADQGEVQFLAELAGTLGRGAVVGGSDDSVSLVPGLRYAADHWGVTLAAVFTAYEAPTKKNATGGTLSIHATF